MYYIRLELDVYSQHEMAEYSDENNYIRLELDVYSQQ